MKIIKGWYIWSLIGVFLLGFSFPVTAQQMQQPQPNYQTQVQQGQKQQRQQQQPNLQGQTQQGQQQMDMLAVGLEPINQIAVAFDFDRDGQIDAVDYVNPNLPPMLIVDQQLRRQQGQMQQNQQMQNVRQSSRNQRAYKVQGTVQDMRTTRLVGSEEQRVFALVQTQQGKKVAVNLGPQWKVNQLQLKKGDQITAFGRVRQVDERPVLAAFNVRAGNQRISVPQPQAQLTQSERGIGRYDVTLINTRTDQVRGGPNVVLGKVRLQDGTTTLVNLGPEKQLGNLKLQQNQNLRILARPVLLEGQQALVAERVATGGQQVDIDWQEVRAGKAAGA